MLFQLQVCFAKTGCRFARLHVNVFRYLISKSFKIDLKSLIFPVMNVFVIQLRDNRMQVKEAA